MLLHTGIYPSFLPPRFVRPLFSPHPRISRIRCPSHSASPAFSLSFPFVFARLIFLFVISLPSFLSIILSLSVSCLVIPRLSSNRALLKLLFELPLLWRPSYALGRNCTRYWVSQSQMIRKQLVLSSSRTSSPSIRCLSLNHITSASN